MVAIELGSLLEMSMSLNRMLHCPLYEEVKDFVVTCIKTWVTRTVERVKGDFQIIDCRNSTQLLLPHFEVSLKTGEGG